MDNNASTNIDENQHIFSSELQSELDKVMQLNKSKLKKILTKNILIMLKHQLSMGNPLESYKNIGNFKETSKNLVKDENISYLGSNKSSDNIRKSLKRPPNLKLHIPLSPSHLSPQTDILDIKEIKSATLHVRKKSPNRQNT